MSSGDDTVGAAVGGAVGAVVALLMAGLLYWWCRQRRLKSTELVIGNSTAGKGGPDAGNDEGIKNRISTDVIEINTTI